MYPFFYRTAHVKNSFSPTMLTRKRSQIYCLWFNKSITIKEFAMTKFFDFSNGIHLMLRFRLANIQLGDHIQQLLYQIFNYSHADKRNSRFFNCLKTTAFPSLKISDACANFNTYFSDSSTIFSIFLTRTIKNTGDFTTFTRTSLFPII